MSPTRATLLAILARESLSYAALGRALGVSRNTVQQWATGAVVPPPLAARVLALLDAGTLTLDALAHAGAPHAPGE